MESSLECGKLWVLYSSLSMPMNRNSILVILAIVIFALLGYAAYVSMSSTTPTPNQQVETPVNTQNPPTATSTPTSTSTPQNPRSGTMQIKLALLNTTGEGTGKSRGCDKVTMVTRTVPQSNTPLADAIKALFAEPEGTQPDTDYNFIARTKSTLKFDKATITNGTANIYLTGSLSGLAGVCDDPRAQIQLEETALQFPNVTKVQLYLNNQPTKLTPSQQ